MPPICRVGDKAHCPRDSHGSSCCSHSVSGSATSGSPDVFINGRPVLRLGDPGKHRKCCGANNWVTTEGSTSVFVNGIPVTRIGDATKHCGGKGKMIEASTDVQMG